MHKYYCLLFLPLFALRFQGGCQVLTLKNAIDTGVKNYGIIKAKADYLRASQASVKEAASEYLPNLSVAAQQAYGTINGQLGPVFPIGGLNAASSGPSFASQNWNAAFGGLYLANINWDFFTFGRVQQRVNLARAEVLRESDDLKQEKFQHQVRIAAAYLNLQAAQRLKLTQQRNVERATALRTSVVVRTQNGLNPGVDSSLANAELGNAKIALNNAINFENEQASQLAELIAINNQDFVLDTFFVYNIPATLSDSFSTKPAEHPLLKFYQSRINVSRQQEKYFNRFKYPVFSLIGVAQSRGAGFSQDYSEQSPEAYTHDYWNGVKPTRSNYLFGIGISWNITSLKRIQQQVASQEWTSRGLQNEYERINQQINSQLILADRKMKTAIANYNEAPLQMKAASDAYLQKSLLYKNGLTDIVDVTQTLFSLNRAETNRDISVNNVWQALLLKAAAAGDFGLFENEF